MTMTRLAAILAAALLLAASCHAAANLEIDSPETCNSCVKAGQSLHRTLVDAAGNPRAMMKLQEELCGFHPAAGQRTCGELLQRGVPALSLKSSSPAQSCTDLGLCTKAEALSHLAKTGSNNINCPLCEYLMVMLKEQLSDPATEEEIIAQANQVCADLPVDAQPTCLQYVAEYSKQIFAWVKSADPESICAQAGMCDQATRLSELPATLKKAAVKLLSIGDDDQCNTCQMVIIEASSVLSDPETQKEILEYVKQSCADFQSFKDQCEGYIDLYGPMIIQMAKQYLKPELCTQLGFCPAQEISFSA